MKRILISGLLSCMLLAVNGSVWATHEDVEVSLVLRSGNKYYQPIGDTFVFRTQPIALYVCIANITDSAVQINVVAADAYSFELKDEQGGAVTVRKKKAEKPVDTGDAFIMLPTGQSKYREIQLDGDLWEGFPQMEPAKTHKYQIRAVYETSSQKYYSKWYTLTLAFGAPNK